MNRFKSMICLLCVLAVSVCTFAACGKKHGPSATQTQDTGGNQDTSDVFDYETGDRLDPSLNYGNEIFSIYSWNTQLITEWVEDDSGKLTEVDQALYNHLHSVEERLTLDIQIQTVPGRYDQRYSFVTNLETRMKAGFTSDLVCQYSLTSSIGMLKGLYGNLLEAPHIDFEAPWWNKSLVEGNIINDRLYYMTGDITPTVTYNMYALMFNKTLLESYGLESPYTLVEEGNWTYSRFMELIKDTALNPNSNHEYGGSAENVMYGLTLPKLSVDALQTGFGIVAVEKNSSGDWTFTRDYTGTKAVNIVDTIRTMAYSNSDIFYDQDSTYGAKIFQDNHTIFHLGVMSDVESSVRDNEMKVGIAPVPKYDAAQLDYGTRLGITVSMFSIPAGLQTFERSGAVLEALASDGYHHITPVIFEKTFCARYADEPEDADMFILIRNSIVYDPGNTQDKLSTFSAFRNCVRENSSWTTYLQGKMTAYATALGDINAMGKG